MKNTKIGVLILLLPLLFSCNQKRKNIISALKNKEDIPYFSYNIKRFVSFGQISNEIEIDGKPDISDYIVDEASLDEINNFSDEQKDIVRSFVTTYFFLSKEKFENLFPKRNIKIGRTLTNFTTVKSHVYIKYYINKEYKCFHYYEYDFKDSYFYLYSYSYYTFNRINTNYISLRSK